MGEEAGELISCVRPIGVIALAATALTAGGEATARGASGLDDRATATAEACRGLAKAWRRTGRAPAAVEILGWSRQVVDLSDEGVLPGVDVQHALQSAFDSAAALPAPVLFLPPTTAEKPYLRSGGVTLAAEGAEFCGYGARLIGTDAADLGLAIAADGVGLYGLTMEAPPEAFTNWVELWRRSSGSTSPDKFPNGSGGSYGTWASHVVVHGAADLVLRDISILGAKRGGMRLYGASNVLIEKACIYRTFSDGIHIVNGSEHVTVRNSRVVQSGDDCISVVTYDRDEQPRTVSDVLIENNICEGSRTRGLTVIGGENVDIIGNAVRDTLMAGILLYPSPTHNTYPVLNVSVKRNRLDGTGLRRDPCSNCGAIVVNDPGPGMVDNVTINGNSIAPRTVGSPVRTASACTPVE